MLFVNALIAYMPDMASNNPWIDIEVACATEAKQKVIRLQVPNGTRLAEAVALSGIADEFPKLDILSSKMGIYGHLESPDRILVDGDRVEIYRPLVVSPGQARLNRATASKRNAAAAKQNKGSVPD